MRPLILSRFLECRGASTPAVTWRVCFANRARSVIFTVLSASRGRASPATAAIAAVRQPFALCGKPEDRTLKLGGSLG